MKAKRIIPCMDIKDGRVVKGVRFDDLQDVDDPVALAAYYNSSGADELVFYDITASVEERKLFSDVLRRTARQAAIPLMVGGGISELADFDLAMDCGADKISVNTGAVKNPALLSQAAAKYGAACVALAMDVKRVGGAYHVFLRGGKEDTGKDAIEWAVFGQEHGAGELVVNSIDTDGVKTGFDIPLLKEICARVRIPVIASGGAGGMQDFLDLFQKVPAVDAGLAASVFHRKQVRIPELKAYLHAGGIAVRI